MRSTSERLYDILEAIDRIERYSIQGQHAFAHEELIQNWIVHHLQIIGEAANALPEEIRALRSDVPWRNIIGMRHILVHHYFAIDLDVTWNVIEKHLPDLKDAITSIIEKSS
ncbi:HepT-like ribonuclease domain-containing protein [Candidatus Viridilinea mediisalina]|uniref:Nucleotidyltransferase n=1 Tax=Candidatus Viridilinea mediisalina TaxID=2024553 RepID=A0A2A6RJ12_9CHLR|nr:DUF86 domain-containing protein [Candidatus Viridilinea mediisalina]PDW02931.1 nucleotidyltransferase [Candidatus Viridilinea mediisalina]